MPTNLYGPNDNFDLKTSHVLPAMIRKFHEAKLKEDREGHSEPVELWGSGSPMREFLHVDDLGQAVLFALEHKLDDHLYNVGSGTDITIKALAELIQGIVGHKGEIIWDDTKPDGTPKKLMDSSKLNVKGWRSTIDLENGIKITYDWFLKNQESIKKLNFT
jgi:GDP-L-fucose synthase